MLGHHIWWPPASTQRATFLSDGGRRTPALCGADGGEVPLPRRLRRLLEVLRSQPSSQQRNLCLVRIGDRLPRAPLGTLGESTRVFGCTSVVHIHARLLEDGKLELSGAADSRVARGLTALVARGLQGEPASSLDGLNSRLIGEAGGLHTLMVASRLNGIDNMLTAIRAQVTPRLERSGERSQSAEHRSVGGEGANERADEGSPLSWAQPAAGWSAAQEEVAVLLSGGVDSSVALHTLLEAGHRCRAFYLRIWLEDEQAEAARGACPWEEDWAYCTAVCQQAGVPLESISLQKEYSEHVVGYLLAEAAAGRTPNPDIMCNSRIKFGVFHDRVGRHFQAVASGHYAQVVRLAAGDDDGTVQLLRSADAHKDQTYFLSQLRQVCRA